MESKESKGNITSEQLRKKFKSQFELVSYAIKLAENMIKSGRESRVKTDLHSKALQVLLEIAQNKDLFDEIIIEEEEEIEEPQPPAKERRSRSK